MMVAYDLPEAAPVDVRVDLRGSDVGMAEHLLDDAKICAAHEQMRGETVSQFVGMDLLQSRDRRILADELPDRDPFERSAGE
jgi:hypothetical protein